MTAPDPRRFLYRSLDPDGAKRLAAGHLSNCDDGDLYLQYSVSEAFGFDDGRLKTADYNNSSGFGLRESPGTRPPSRTPTRSAKRRSSGRLRRSSCSIRQRGPQPLRLRGPIRRCTPRTIR
jgi:TldD protein